MQCLARQPWRVGPSRATTAVVAGDCLGEASLVAAMDGIDQAYYLVHSMASGPGFAAPIAVPHRTSAARPPAQAYAASSISAGLGDSPESSRPT